MTLWAASAWLGRYRNRAQMIADDVIEECGGSVSEERKHVDVQESAKRDRLSLRD